MNPLKRLLRRWRQARFDRAVARLLRERLGPELDIGNLGPPVRSKTHRRVHIADSARGKVVVRLFHGRKRRYYTETFVRAHALFHEAETPVAPLWFHDAGARGGIGCVVQQYVEGVPFSPDRHTALAPDLARILANLHRNTAPEFGRLSQLRPADPNDDPIATTIGRKLQRFARLPNVARAPRREREALIQAIANWFRQWPNRPGGDIGGWSLLHGDLLPGNVIVTPADGLSLLDLDRATRDVYGLELIHLPLRFIIAPAQWSSIETLDDFWKSFGSRIEPALGEYFDRLPVEFRRDWDANRNYYLAWGMLIHASELDAPLDIRDKILGQ